MTIDEAIKNLRTLWIAQVLKANVVKEDGHPLESDFVTAVNMAIDALDKQIPKVPRLSDDYYDYDYHCPRCGAYITGVYADKCCCECGQALDWSDEE